MKQHRAQSGKKAGQWVNCYAKKCRLGGMHINKETLKQVQAWKNDSATERTNLSDISEEDINSFSNLSTEIKEVYAADLKYKIKSENDSNGIAKEYLTFISKLDNQKKTVEVIPRSYGKEDKKGLTDFFYNLHSASMYPDSDRRRNNLIKSLETFKENINKYFSEEDIDTIFKKLNKAAKKRESAHSVYNDNLSYQSDIRNNLSLGSHHKLNEEIRKDEELANILKQKANSEATIVSKIFKSIFGNK